MLSDSGAFLGKIRKRGSEEAVDKISIIVPIYNAEKYIDKALQSICGQTYENIEILLIDDGSGDNSLKRCEEWAKKDARISVYHQKNAGASAARNKGIELATGKYLMFIDGDDWIEANMLEILYEEAEKHQADAACCILQEESVEQPSKKNDVKVDKAILHSQGKIRCYSNKAESGLALLSVWGPVCKLYRSDVIGDCRFEDYQVAEDLLFNTKVICSKKFTKAVLVEYPFYHYIIYPGSTMKQKLQKKYLTAMEVEKQCYDMLTAISPKFADINLIGCSVSRVFEKYAQLSKEERKQQKADFLYCKRFAKAHKKQLLGSSNRHRKISGALKVYIPDIYLWLLVKRYEKVTIQNRSKHLLF